MLTNGTTTNDINDPGSVGPLRGFQDEEISFGDLGTVYKHGIITAVSFLKENRENHFLKINFELSAGKILPSEESNIVSAVSLLRYWTFRSSKARQA